MVGKNKGSILVFILALIVLLSVLCMRLMKETVQELRHVSQFHRRDDLRMHAYSALDVAVGALNEFMMIERTLYAPSQGWGDPLSYAEISPLDSRVQWTISLIDESGKVPISAISEKDLVSLFSIMRAEEDSLVNEDDGQPFYDSLMDWQDADDEERDEGAEDDFYEDLEFPYFTPGKKIESFEEFQMNSSNLFGFIGNQKISMTSMDFYVFKKSPQEARRRRRPTAERSDSKSQSVRPRSGPKQNPSRLLRR